MENVPSDANVLDLGCGNAGIAVELARRSHHGRYVGMDFSAGLLQEAKKKVQGSIPHVEFVQADLTGEFDQHLSIKGQEFDWIFAFAVLHHIPSDELRRAFVRRVQTLLASNGRFTFSVWQFLSSPRLKERIQPWTSVHMQDADVGSGDYLIDWRSGGLGLRYVHHFSEGELQRLADLAGFSVTETYYSDGENGKLGLYQIWGEGS